MNKTTKILMAAFGIAALVSCAPRSEKAAGVSEKDETTLDVTGAKTFAIANTESEVGWKGTKIGGEHWGTIDVKEGNVFVKEGAIAGGEFTIDMNSITVLDIQDAETAGKLKGHLQSDDFFSTEKHPEAKFIITSVSPIANAAEGAPNYTLKGNLTIKEITKAIEFTAWVDVKDAHVAAKADFDLDRTEWDVRFGSSRFFPNIGDRLIHDKFNIKLNIVARAS